MNRGPQTAPQFISIRIIVGVVVGTPFFSDLHPILRTLHVPIFLNPRLKTLHDAIYPYTNPVSRKALHEPESKLFEGRYVGDYYKGAQKGLLGVKTIAHTARMCCFHCAGQATSEAPATAADHRGRQFCFRSYRL